MQLKRKAYATAIIALLTLSLVLAAVPIQPVAASPDTLTIEVLETPDPYPAVNTTYTLNFTITQPICTNSTGNGNITITFPTGYHLPSPDKISASTNATAESGGTVTFEASGGNLTVDGNKIVLSATAKNITGVPAWVYVKATDVTNPSKADTYTFNITTYSGGKLAESETKDVTINSAKLVFIEVPDYVASNVNKTFTIQVQKTDGTPITLQGYLNVTLEGNSTRLGTFYNETGTNAQAANWTIIGYGSSSSSFLYELDPISFTLGDVVNVTVSCAGWENATVYIPIELGYGSSVTVNVGDKLIVTNSTGATPGGEVKIYWDAVKDWDGSKGYLTNTYAESDGSFEVEITVPEAVAESHYIYVFDVITSKLIPEGSYFATVYVEPKIVLSPTSGLPGDTFTVTGTGFAADEEITLTANVTDAFIMPEEKPKTGALGDFTAEIQINETAVVGPYLITATDESEHSASAIFEVTYYITVDPEESPPGVKVQVSGRIENDKEVTVKFGREGFWIVAFTTTSDEETGEFSGEYVIPSTLEAGIFWFNATWDNRFCSVEFEVTEPPEISLNVTEAYAGETVTVTGDYFCAEANVTIYFDTIVVNATVATDEDGHFEAIFVVPDVAADEYEVKAVDQFGASATADFTVKPPKTIIIETRSTQYQQGDTVSIYVNCSESYEDVLMEVRDPDEALFWSTTVNITKKVDSWYTVEDRLEISLPSDAPTGTWNFTAYDSKGEILDTNLFTVSLRAALGVEELSERVSALEQSITDLRTTVDELSESVETISTAIAGLNIPELNETIVSVKSDVEGLKSDLESVTSDVSEVSEAISEVKSAVQSAVDAASEAKAAAESASVAVSNISTAVYGAIILSLIAAVAAIMAVVTLQRKIAG